MLHLFRPQLPRHLPDCTVSPRPHLFQFPVLLRYLPGGFVHVLATVARSGPARHLILPLFNKFTVSQEVISQFRLHTHCPTYAFLNSFSSPNAQRVDRAACAAIRCRLGSTTAQPLPSLMKCSVTRQPLTKKGHAYVDPCWVHNTSAD